MTEILKEVLKKYKLENCDEKGNIKKYKSNEQYVDSKENYKKSMQKHIKDDKELDEKEHCLISRVRYSMHLRMNQIKKPRLNVETLKKCLQYGCCQVASKFEIRRGCKAGIQGLPGVCCKNKNKVEHLVQKWKPSKTQVARIWRGILIGDAELEEMRNSLEIEEKKEVLIYERTLETST